MKTILALALVLAPALSFAIDNPDAKVSTIKDSDIASINHELEKCEEKDYSTAGMRECISDAIKAADSILNKEYRAKTHAMKRAKDPQSKELLKRLVKAERAWIAFRDAEISLAGATDLGGTAEPVDIDAAFLEMTEARIVTIRNL